MLRRTLFRACTRRLASSIATASEVYYLLTQPPSCSGANSCPTPAHLATTVVRTQTSRSQTAASSRPAAALKLQGIRHSKVSIPPDTPAPLVLLAPCLLQATIRAACCNTGHLHPPGSTRAAAPTAPRCPAAGGMLKKRSPATSASPRSTSMPSIKNLHPMVNSVGVPGAGAAGACSATCL